MELNKFHFTIIFLVMVIWLIFGLTIVIILYIFDCPPYLAAITFVSSCIMMYVSGIVTVIIINIHRGEWIFA
jgi:hypothetical protein